MFFFLILEEFKSVYFEHTILFNNILCMLLSLPNFVIIYSSSASSSSSFSFSFMFFFLFFFLHS